MHSQTFLCGLSMPRCEDRFHGTYAGPEIECSVGIRQAVCWCHRCAGVLSSCYRSSDWRLN